jgi:chromate transport protein ChrA
MMSLLNKIINIVTALLIIITLILYYYVKNNPEMINVFYGFLAVTIIILIERAQGWIADIATFVSKKIHKQ